MGDFFGGVVEGFYGRPWTAEQRKNLFVRLKSLGLSMYVYAPKDDLKHRAHWRNLYTVEEAELLKSLIDAATENSITFCYALSPGLDITYSSRKEVNSIKQKFEQVQRLGCTAFALLFDDIESTMTDTDQEVFASFAHAQVCVTNDVYEFLHQPTFIFCPTEYCSSRALPDLNDSEYLRVVGEKLLPAIKILWTGPIVISQYITVSHVKAVTRVFRRKPLIWDNYHANDYDPRRLFLGPYTGRSLALQEHVSGILTNPNCEFEANFIPFHTLAQWCRSERSKSAKSSSRGTPDEGSPRRVTRSSAKGDKEVSDRSRSSPSAEYDPRVALENALDAWYPMLARPRNAFLADGLYNYGGPIGGGAQSSVLQRTASTENLTAMAEHVIVNPMIMSMATDPSVDDHGQISLERQLSSIPPDAPVELFPTRPVDIEEPEGGKDEGPGGTPGVAEVATPIFQAINSLAAAYDEPMELAPPAISSKSKTPSDSEMQDGNAEPQIDPAKIAAKLSSNSPGGDSSGSKHAGASATGALQKHGTKGGEPQNANSDDDTVMESCVEDMVIELNRADLEMIVGFFYLPFDHGPMGQWCLDEFRWFKAHALAPRDAKTKSGQQTAASKEFMSRCDKFFEVSLRLNEIVARLQDIPNRGLIYELYPYLWEAASMVMLVSCYVRWLANGSADPLVIPEDEDALLQPAAMEPSRPHCAPDASPGSTDEPEQSEPWSCRGGLLGELQRELPLETGQDLFTTRPPFPPCSQMFSVRPADLSVDRPVLYDLCLQTLDDGLDATPRFARYPGLVGDAVMDTFFAHAPEYLFIVECKETGPVGFAYGSLDAQRHRERAAAAPPEGLRAKYTALLDCSKVVGMSTTTSSDGNDATMASAAPLNGTDASARDDTPTKSMPNTDAEESDINAGYYQPVDMARMLQDNPAPAVPSSVHCRYPSYVNIRVLPSIMDTAAPKRLSVALLCALKSNGSAGVFTSVKAQWRNTQDLYARLGFFQVTMLDDAASDDVTYLGRIL